MKSAAPVDLALRHICEAKQILERLILSSESFDYFAAKETLEHLKKQIRHLAKAQAELERETAAANSPPLSRPFGNANARAARPDSIVD